MQYYSRYFSQLWIYSKTWTFFFFCILHFLVSPLLVSRTGLARIMELPHSSQEIAATLATLHPDDARLSEAK